MSLATFLTATYQNRVFHMTTQGLMIKGKGTKVHCLEGEFFGNKAAGIEVADGANVVLVENVVKHNGGQGVLVRENCLGSMVRNQVQENSVGNVVSYSSERKFVVG